MNRRFYCDERTEVMTAAGKVRGCFVNDLYYFRGIPYAEAERYEAPKPIEHWDGVLEAVTYGPVAPTVQKPDVTSMNALSQQPLFGYRFWPEDEKCQYINVWTTKPESGRKRPVMVWVHGGGFSTGSSVEQMSYDGANLCRDGDLVVVSFNHRLNILGFLDMSDYGEKYWNSGNAGMADIVEALKWVRKNIDKFGGDPDNVTLFGQSGGGGKIQTLLQTPAADGLYNRVIFQSGLMHIADTEDRQPKVSKKMANALVAKLGLTKETFEEIKKVPFEKLREAFLSVCKDFEGEGMNVGMMLGPVHNDWYLGAPLDFGFREHAKSIPVMCGSVLCETVLYMPTFTPYTVSAEKRQEMLTELFGDDKDYMIDLFEKAYPGRDIMDLYNLDRSTRQGTVEFADAMAGFGNKVWNYMISYQLGYFGGMPSYHGICLPLVFGNTEYVDALNEPDAVALSQKMHQAWINFATNGDPNGGDVPEWKQYKTGECGTMIFDKQCEMRYDYDRELLSEYQKKAKMSNSFVDIKMPEPEA
ncbi:MAG: carboxylesterase family protein [Oscillospiraceae bacterium]|nr:carboxylesterase family protein [Oscillospiraceae bacterium]